MRSLHSPGESRAFCLLFVLFFIYSNFGAAQNINRAEYFFDIDPGAGKATGFAVSSTANLSFTGTVSLSGLQKGFHTLCIRTRNNQGKWSLAEGRAFYISAPIVNASSITAAEYYVDTDPGAGKGTPIAVTPGSTVIACTNISLPALPLGGHTLFLRVKDNIGNWSIQETTAINITAATNITISAPETIIKCHPVILTATTTGGTWAYQWYKDCDAIGGATSQTYTATTEGNYSVLITQGGNTQFANPVTVTSQPDITPPVITCPANIITCTAVVNFAPTVTDECSVTLVSNPPSGSIFPLGTTSVLCTATDAAGNQSSCSFNVTVMTTPARPGTITGNTAVCAGGIQTYSIAPVANADSYTWGLPSGWNIISGQGTTSITATAGIAGDVKVASVNSCGSSALRRLTVSVNAVPAQPGPITGNTSVTAGSTQNYSIGAVANATGYTWSVPAGWQITSGQGTTNISVITGATGNISVTANNGLCSSAPQLLNINVISSAITKLWDKRFGGSLDDGAFVVIETLDGGYLLGGYSSSPAYGDKTKTSWGYSNDYWIVKTDACGNKLWDKTFGGFGDDRLTSIQQTSDGGFILGGTSFSYANEDKTETLRGNFGCDYWIIKTDVNGNKLWDKTFGGLDYDYLTTILQAIDGGYMLGGYSFSPVGFDKTSVNKGGLDYWIVKTDATGTKLWDKTFGGTTTDNLSSMQQTSDGGYILGGTSASGISGDKTEPLRGAVDYWIVKTDANGNKIYDKTFGGTGNDQLNALQQTKDGGFILGGYSNSGIGNEKSEASKGMDNYWIIKTDANGNKIWDKSFGGTTVDRLNSLQQASDNGYVLAGYSNSIAGGDKTETTRGGLDYWMVKTDEVGTKIWDKTIGGARADGAYSVRQTTNGDFIIAGNSQSKITGDKTENSRGSYDYWVVKLGNYSETPLTLITGAVPLNICPGQTISVPYTSTGNFTSCNVFYAQLSNATGSFADPLTIGSQTGPANNGFITSVIPVGLTPGTGYRIRVFAYSPSIFGSDNGTDISVTAPVVTITSASYNCPGKTTVLTCSPADTYLWNTSATTQSITVNTGGNYSVTATIDGCKGVASKPIQQLACEKTTAITVSNLTPTSATLTWTPVTCADGYTFFLSSNSGQSYTRVLKPTIKFANLIPGTTYSYKVQTICNPSPPIVSAYTNLASFTTPLVSIATKNESATIVSDFEVLVAPNPASDIALITVKSSTKPLTIILADISGKILWQKDAPALKGEGNNMQVSIPMQNFANGTYMVTVADAEHRKTLKLIKAK